MRISELFIPGKVMLPHQARQQAESLGYRGENLYENLEMESLYANCTCDILYSSDTVPIHTHSFYEVALCESGNAQYIADKQRFFIQPGDITIIPPGIRHCPINLHSMATPYKRIIFFINPVFFEEIFSVQSYCEKKQTLFTQSQHFQTIGTPHEKLWKFFQMGILENNPKNPYSESFLCGLTICLLTKLMEATDTTLSPTIKTQKELLENIITYVEDHLSEKITLDDITKQFHVSKSSITKLFQNTMGYSFHDYVVQTRLDEAKNLLQKNVNLDTIAQMVGFGDYSNFYRTFKKEYHMTPSEYRSNLTLLSSFFLKVQE